MFQLALRLGDLIWGHSALTQGWTGRRSGLDRTRQAPMVLVEVGLLGPPTGLNGFRAGRPGNQEALMAPWNVFPQSACERPGPGTGFCPVQSPSLHMFHTCGTPGTLMHLHHFHLSP